MILADAAERPPAENIVIYLGDYVDRGHDSRGVIEMLANHPLEGFQSIYLMGNHEDFMVRFLEDPKLGPALDRQWRQRDPDELRRRGRQGL